MKKAKSIAEHIDTIEKSGKGFTNPEIARKVVHELQAYCKADFERMHRLEANSWANSLTVVVK